MTKLFISYSTVDKQQRRELVDLLELVYDDVWCDEELIGGKAWWAAILRQIEACDYFLFLISPESLNSKYCRGEFLHARKHGKTIIPIRVRARTELPEPLESLQCIDWYDASKQEGLARIFGAIVRAEDKRRAHEDEILAHDERVLDDLWEYLDEQKHNHFLRFPRKLAINGSDSFYYLEVYTLKRRRAEYALLDSELESLFTALDEAILQFVTVFAEYTLEPSAVDEFAYFNVEHPDAEQGEEFLEALWDDIRKQHRQVYRLVRARYPTFFDDK